MSQINQKEETVTEGGVQGQIKKRVDIKEMTVNLRKIIILIKGI